MMGVGYWIVARQVRRLGYTGRLILVGDLISDQFAAEQSCGFDGVLPHENPAPDAVVNLDLTVSFDSPGGSRIDSPLNDIATGSHP